MCWAGRGRGWRVVLWGVGKRTIRWIYLKSHSDRDIILMCLFTCIDDVCGHTCCDLVNSIRLNL